VIKATNQVEYNDEMVRTMNILRDKKDLTSKHQDARVKSEPETEPEVRWQVVQNRDRRFGGAFVYAVRSRGIYCRCTCPSRRPNRQQVSFFSDLEPASQAGFRACLRCHPDKSLPADRHMDLVRVVCRHIQEAEDGPPRLTGLSSALTVSFGHMQRVFKRQLGVKPRQFAGACRQERFKARLKSGLDITYAMYYAGYGSTRRLNEASLDHLGMNPESYKREGGELGLARRQWRAPCVNCLWLRASRAFAL